MKKSEFKSKGYLTLSGYFGKLENGEYRLFPTEEEYKEYCKDILNKEEKSNGSSKKV